jgi:hypothetical protein
MLRAANSFTPILGYGTVQIHASPATPEDDFCTLTLMDVAYVPSFHTNLVSFGREWVKGIRWDIDNIT